MGRVLTTMKESTLIIGKWKIVSTKAATPPITQTHSVSIVTVILGLELRNHFSNGQ